MSENPQAPVPAPLDPESKASSKANALVVQFKEFDKKAEGWIQSWNPYHPEVVKNRPLQPVIVEESRIRRSAAKYFLIAFLGFMAWASFAPIDAGVNSPGTVMVSGYRKSLQHPTGGVVQDIMVKEGDEVKEGDVLIRINPLKAEAELTAAELSYINALVTEARLLAERQGASKITWPPEIVSRQNDPKVQEAKQIQQKLFETRRIEIVGAINARRIQVQTLAEEARNNEQLAKEGFVPKAQANQTLRSKVEAELALNTLQANYSKEIENQLSEIQKNRDALKGRLEAFSFDRDLTSIRAPVSGTVVGLKVNTKGGTIASNQVLAEVVPKEVALIVDAQISPTSIDKVKVGLPVDLRFTTFNQNITPVIPGIVKMVGADKQAPPQGGQGGDFYLAQIEATEEGLKKLGNLQIQAGMPVEVIVKTGERTFLSYLLKPLTDKLAAGFKN